MRGCFISEYLRLVGLFCFRLVNNLLQPFWTPRKHSECLSKQKATSWHHGGHFLQKILNTHLNAYIMCGRQMSTLKVFEFAQEALCCDDLEIWPGRVDSVMYKLPMNQGTIFIWTELIIYCGKDSPSMPHQAADASWLMVIHTLCCFNFHLHMVQQSSPTSYKDLTHLWGVLWREQQCSVEYWLDTFWNLPTNWRKIVLHWQIIFSL